MVIRYDSAIAQHSFIPNHKQIVAHLPPNTDPYSIIVANSPAGGEENYLKDVAKYPVTKTGLKYVACYLKRWMALI